MKEITESIEIKISGVKDLTNLHIIRDYLYINEYKLLESFFPVRCIVIYKDKRYSLFSYEPHRGRLIYTSEEFINKFIKEDDMENAVKLTLEEAKELYNAGGNFKTIALGAYNEEELTQPKLPNTWEEFCSNYPIKTGEVFIDKESSIESGYKNYGVLSAFRGINIDRNLIPNKKIAEAILALCQLIQLRDCYNQDWKPDWTVNTTKYCIDSNCNIVIKDSWGTCSRIMAFKTKELRDKFFNNFKDLLETAKELL